MGYLIQEDGDLSPNFEKVTGERLNSQRISLICQLEKGTWTSDVNRGLPLLNIYSGRYTTEEITTLIELEASKVTDNIQNVNISRQGKSLGIIIKHGVEDGIN